MKKVLIKKALALLLCGAMLFAVGCSAKGDTSSKASSQETPATSTIEGTENTDSSNIEETSSKVEDTSSKPGETSSKNESTSSKTPSTSSKSESSTSKEETTSSKESDTSSSSKPTSPTIKKSPASATALQQDTSGQVKLTLYIFNRI